MKLKCFLKTTAIALCGFAALGSASKAATFSASDADLILGFFISGATQTDNLMVDLGPASQFYNAAPGSTFSLTGTTALALADLSSIYGSSWFTNTSLFWGVAGMTNGGTTDAHSPDGTVWITAAETIPGTKANRAAVTTSTLNTADAHIGSLYSELTNKTSTANSSKSYDASTGDPNSYYKQDTSVTPGTNFGVFSNPLSDNSYNNVSGTQKEISDLYELQPGASLTSKGTSTYLGYFTLSSTGLTFTAAPEPTSAVLAIGAGLVLLGRRRRA